MRIRYDASVDMAYIYLREIAPGGVATTVPGWPDTEAFGINLDFDADGGLVGIDVSAASRRLPAELLVEAESL
jgi:uncharacterized protein YuzE